jgi:geranylgeranyl pyrophosphate synthase
MSTLAQKEPASPAESALPLSLPATSRALDAEHLERALLRDARDFLARPAKAFRARFIEASFALCGGEGSVPSACVEAIELLHAGSLIVDDIQDGADERRGGPALHRVIGMPRALNTGNWLYFVALSKLHEIPLPAERALSVLREAHLCLTRCHEGQALDLALTLGEVRKHETQAVALATSQLKTGALMAFACALGAHAAGAEVAALEAVSRFGERLGVALQMLDDCGSVLSDTRQHKAREDLAAQRVSWAFALAAEELDDLSYVKLVRSAARPEEHGQVLERLREVLRGPVRGRVRAELSQAMAALADVFPHSLTRDLLSAELVRLEKSYG